MRKYKTDLFHFLQNKCYMAALMLTLLLSYGYSIATVSVGIDTLEGDRYVGSGGVMLSTGRFGMNFWAGLLGYGTADPSYQPGIDLLAAILLGAAAVHFCMLLHKVSNGQISMFGYGVFSCIFISYPLINEIWEYSGANVCVCGGYLLDAIALNLLWDSWHQSGVQKLLRFTAASVCMLIVCSSYESLAVVYVLAVFAMLSLQEYESKEKTRFLALVKEGLWYAAALIVGVCLRVFLQMLINMVLPAQASANGATAIAWVFYPFEYLAKLLIKNLIIQYWLRGCFYLPIRELTIAVVIFVPMIVIVAMRCRKKYLLFTGAGMLLSLVLLSLLQGVYSAYRTCQTFALFFALVVLAVYEILCKLFHKRNLIVAAVQLGLAVLCVHQAMYLNHMLALNYERSNEEAAVVRSIGTELEQSYDISKPVVLVGQYTLAGNITRYTTANPNQSVIYKQFREHKPDWETGDIVKYVDTNCNSVLTWAAVAFGELDGVYGSAAENLFQYYGFNFTMQHSEILHKQAQAYAEEHALPGYPQAGSIVDRGAYLLVNLR